MTGAQRSCSTCGALLDTNGVCLRCGPARDPEALVRGATAEGTGRDAAFLPTAPVRDESGARRSDPRPDGELESGQVVAGRYRVVRPLGKGGMGEVVLARDLELDQPIALKFLPLELRHDPDHLARLREEVKLARRVSHPNVCRVHDLGESRGRAFLTMEYVDGEDLGALLRRIGRLPPEKAVELAHQLCSGLHAAHEQGILHRDLKPANVMIDGEGRLKITDFGLAALAHQVGGAHVREGTPAYMAPEQLAGAEVTKKSDIYALGLVLYELFTGKRAHGAERRVDTRPARPATLLDGFDPAIERVIMRCLEPEPDDRPSSVLAVAAGLPGGDPIGAALAAGELPSPEMLAASGETGTLRPRTAVMLLVLVLVPLVVLGVLFESGSVLGRLPSPDSPDVLAHGAREIAEELAVLPEGDAVHWLDVDNDAVRWLGERHAAEGESVFDDPPIHPLQLVWRAEERSLNPREPLVSTQDPPFVQDGALRVRVDARGRLLQLRRIPPALESAAAEGDDERAWTILMARTGLVLDRVQPATPAMLPRDYADERRAWTGEWPDGTPAHVEGASVKGVPVEFTVFGPWQERYREIEAGHGEEAAEEGTVYVGTSRGVRVVEGIGIVLVSLLALVVLLVVGGAFLLAIRSLRRGEGDRRTAGRVALFVTLGTYVSGTLGSHMIGSALLTSPFDRLPFALLDGLVIWLAYIALEPYARRFWPHALVSWSRFVRARWRDPLVGRDVLLGTACASVLVGIGAVVSSFEPSRLDATDRDALLGARHAIATVLDLPRSGLWIACLAFVAVLVARLTLRRNLPTVIATILAPAIVITTIEPTWLNALTGLASGLSLAIVVFRAGLLGAIAWATTVRALNAFPWTLETTAWYAGVGSLGGLLVAGLAIASFWFALGGRPLLGEAFFGERRND